MATPKSREQAVFDTLAGLEGAERSAAKSKLFHYLYGGSPGDGWHELVTGMRKSLSSGHPIHQEYTEELRSYSTAALSHLADSPYLNPVVRELALRLIRHHDRLVTYDHETVGTCMSPRNIYHRWSIFPEEVETTIRELALLVCRGCQPVRFIPVREPCQYIQQSSRCSRTVEPPGLHRREFRQRARKR